MLQSALDSLARMDIDTARQVIGADKAIDAAFNAILRQLITYMMEDPRTISEALDIIWIVKAIERVGDHASNIAENVIYIVSGDRCSAHRRCAHESGRRVTRPETSSLPRVLVVEDDKGIQELLRFACCAVVTSRSAPTAPSTPKPSCARPCRILP
jgi:hypothetical protein